MNLSDEPKSMVSGNGINDNSELQNSTIKKLGIVKNLITLCLTFTFLFSAYMALANLQSTLNNIGNIGVTSQSIIYGALMISSSFLPKLMIKHFGCKTTLVISSFTYIPYIAANMHPRAWTLLPTAVLLGSGAATLWCSASTYINDLSFMYVDGEEDNAKLMTSRFFGIFLMFFQSTQIWGNLVTYFVLKPSYFNSTEKLYGPNNSVGSSDNGVLCGAKFCGGLNQVLQPQPEEKIFMLIGIYLAFSILAVMVSALFLDSFTKEHKNASEDCVISKLLATFKQLKNVDQLLLVVLTTFSGLQQGFIFRDYTEAYIACSWGMENVGLVFVFYGVIDAVVSFSAGYTVKYIPRIVLMSTAATSNIGVIAALLYWSPSSNQSLFFFIIIGFWALSDGIWQTQISAMYGVLFRANEEAAFANYRLWEALGYMIAFICSGILCTISKIHMQILFLSVGYIGYITVELRTFWKKNCYVIETSKDGSFEAKL